MVGRGWKNAEGKSVACLACCLGGDTLEEGRANGKRKIDTEKK